MNYFEISRLLEEARDELLEPVDDSNTMADINHKLFNQGVSLMFNTALLKIVKLEQAKHDQEV